MYRTGQGQEEIVISDSFTIRVGVWTHHNLFLIVTDAAFSVAALSSWWSEFEYVLGFVLPGKSTTDYLPKIWIALQAFWKLTIFQQLQVFSKYPSVLERWRLWDFERWSGPLGGPLVLSLRSCRKTNWSLGSKVRPLLSIKMQFSQDGGNAEPLSLLWNSYRGSYASYASLEADLLETQTKSCVENVTFWTWTSQLDCLQNQSKIKRSRRDTRLPQPHSYTHWCNSCMSKQVKLHHSWRQ